MDHDKMRRNFTTGHVGDPGTTGEELQVPTFTQAHVDYLKKVMALPDDPPASITQDGLVALAVWAAQRRGFQNCINHIESLVLKGSRR